MRVTSKNHREKIRVLIADGDNMRAELLASALRRSRNAFDVVAVENESPEAIRKLETRKPHVAVVSAELQDGPQSGFALLQKLHDSQPRTAAIMLLHSPKRAQVIEAFRGGAKGIISSDRTFKDLSECIRSVHAGKIWASNEQLEFVLDVLTHLKPLELKKDSGMALLTAREQEVVRLVAQGMKNREVARELRVGEHTVSNYLYRIFEKLGVSTRVELIFHAVTREAFAKRSDK
jgi:two-component system, NarL family, nitrate/nitrite response regulator NarL